MIKNKVNNFKIMKLEDLKQVKNKVIFKTHNILDLKNKNGMHKLQDLVKVNNFKFTFMLYCEMI